MIESQATLMEGFIYRTVDPKFPVYIKDKNETQFPKLPIGMLDLWRQTDENPWGFWETHKF